MRLYHFTRASNVRSIRRKGLKPQANHMTGGHEWVWLTTQPDLNLTEREAQWLADHGWGLHGLVPVFTKQGKTRLVPRRTWLFTGGWQPLSNTFVPDTPLVRLTVQIRKSDPRLARWATLRRRPRGPDLRSLPYGRLWHVYEGVITPDRIVEWGGR